VSDESVAAALRSAARLVLIEAPGGCGKTFQASRYAADATHGVGTGGRVLVLAHTHAACDVFTSRIARTGRVEVRTIDGLISQIASAYHLGLGLPADASSWARRQNDTGYKLLASKTAALMMKAPIIAHAVAQRYPVIICDEHQDASADQHAVVMAIYGAGSALRIFGDPMQNIGSSKASIRDADALRWRSLKSQADTFEVLDQPHRWENKDLGKWILQARATLGDGGQINLRANLPPGLSVVFADNSAQRHDQYTLEQQARSPIDLAINCAEGVMVLAAHNLTVKALRPFFNRRIPIWEGHTRDALAVLANAIRGSVGDPIDVGHAVVKFVESIAIGFTPTEFGKLLLHEIENGCTARRRLKPAMLQELGRFILTEPNHRGASKMLARLLNLIEVDAAFSKIRIDNPREYRDAVRLGEFEDCENGLTEISHRRTHSHPMPPKRALSTVHKAKGLECKNVVLMPCDSHHFRNSEAARCLFYVALSRATNSLTLVVSRAEPSPLLVL
jgi:AAA domain/UvrD-like helicase C-terminal domain